VSLPQATSLSPFNPGPWGSSSLVELLEGAGYRVVLGGVDTVASYVRSGFRVAYLVLAPDRQFSLEEAATLRALLGHGLVGVMVADELGVANSLLNGLEVTIGEPIGELATYIRCGSYAILTAKVSTVKGGKNICFTEPNLLPIASVLEARSYRVLVIGDSSIFANYMIGESAELVLHLTSIVADHADVLVLDIEHYDYVQPQALLLPLNLLAALIAVAGLLIVDPSSYVLTLAVVLTTILVVLGGGRLSSRNY
jgi:hypothetical protein